MKTIYIAPIALSLLVACENPKINSTYTPPAQKAEVEEIFEGASGPVEIQISTHETSTPSLPAQIKVSIEKEPKDGSNPEIKALPDAMWNLIVSRSTEVLVLGCDKESTVTELPQKIDVGRLVLCGKIKVPEYLNVRATELEFRNAQLIAQPNTANDPHKPISRLAIFNVRNLTIHGSNTFHLKGFQEGKNVDFAPGLYMSLGRVFGEGTLQIYSHKTVQVMKF